MIFFLSQQICIEKFIRPKFTQRKAVSDLKMNIYLVTYHQESGNQDLIPNFEDLGSLKHSLSEQNTIQI